MSLGDVSCVIASSDFAMESNSSGLSNPRSISSCPLAGSLDEGLGFGVGVGVRVRVKVRVRVRVRVRVSVRVKG